MTRRDQPPPGIADGAVVQQLRRGAQGLVLAMLTLPFLLPTPAAAQYPGVTIVGVDRQGPELVTLLAAVRRSPEGAESAPSFSVDENGQALPVESQLVAADQLEVVVLLDLPEDLEPSARSAVRSAAVELLLQLPDTALAAVVGSGGTPEVVELTAPATAIVQVGELTQGPQRSLSDGIIAAATLESQDDESRRVVVALSAGTETADREEMQPAADDLAAAGAAFYGVVLEETGGDPASLDGVAEAAGGEVLVAAQAEDLVSISDRIARDLANLYEVAYESAAAGSATVSLIVEVAGSRAEATREVPAEPGTAADVPDAPQAGTATEPAQEAAPGAAAADGPEGGDVPRTTTQPSGRRLTTPVLAALAALLAVAALFGAGRSLRGRRQRSDSHSHSGRSTVRREAERRWTEERKRATGPSRAGPVVAPATPRVIRLPEARRGRVIRLPESAPQRVDAGVYRQPLHDALVGEVITSLWGVGPRFAEVAGTFRGKRVTAVEARGPHVLLTFSDSDLVLHTELGVGGIWAVYPVGAMWQRPRRLSRAMVETASATAVCFAPRVCQLLRADQVRSDPGLALSPQRR